MALLIYLLICVVAPASLAACLCEERGRNSLKGFVVTALPGVFGFGGWLVLFFLWLGLKDARRVYHY